MEGFAWREEYIPSPISNEIKKMSTKLENIFQLRSSGGRFLPAGGVTERMLPALRGELLVDVREHDGETIIEADLSDLKKR